jgi:SsrA-binding protein
MAEKSIAENRAARHNYHLLETFEAGLVLTGGEVKALRAGQAQLKDSYALVRPREAVLLNCHISAYANAGYATHEPERSRRLLLHRREIEKLLGKTREKGLTLVPLRLYFRNGRVKCELALAKGKQAPDKRAAERKKESDREARQAMKARMR